MKKGSKMSVESREKMRDLVCYKKFTDGWREADEVEGWDLKALALK